MTQRTAVTDLPDKELDAEHTRCADCKVFRSTHAYAKRCRERAIRAVEVAQEHGHTNLVPVLTKAVAELDTLISATADIAEQNRLRFEETSNERRERAKRRPDTQGADLGSGPRKSRGDFSRVFPSSVS